MTFIKTKYYPYKGFNAITHWPFVFYKKDSDRMRNHENIHGKQQKELLLISLNILFIFSVVFNFEIIFAITLITYLIFTSLTSLSKYFGVVSVLTSFGLNFLFYLIYFIEWIFKGYRKISFENEAYQNQDDYNYLQNRKPFKWIRYV